MSKTDRIPANGERNNRRTNTPITSDKAFMIQKNQSGERRWVGLGGLFWAGKSRRASLSELRPAGGEGVSPWNRILSRRNSQCKGPEA